VRQGSAIRESIRRQQRLFLWYGVAVSAFVPVALIVENMTMLEVGWADAAFYGNAAISLACTLTAYRIQERGRRRVATTGSPNEAMEALLFHNLFTAGAVELAALCALVGFVLTGDPSHLPFVAPFYFVLFLIFPTTHRVSKALGSPP
jgi:hypothetical protein